MQVVEKDDWEFNLGCVEFEINAYQTSLVDFAQEDEFWKTEDRNLEVGIQMTVEAMGLGIVTNVGKQEIGQSETLIRITLV